MDPLQAVEDILGNVESWPTYVIYNIFVEEPCPESIKKVAAFMYGNGVPLDVAFECFNACCGLNCSWVSQTMSKWYSKRDSHPHWKHKAEYYSMSFKQCLRINGEPVRPEDTVMEFGIENTGYMLMIKTTIDHVRVKSVDKERK